MKSILRIAVAALMATSSIGSTASAAVIDLTSLYGGVYNIQDEVLVPGSFFADTYFAPVALKAKFTDIFVQGDAYGVYINGIFAFDSLPPALDGTFIADPRTAYASGKFARGLVSLAAGDTLSFTALSLPAGYTDSTIAVSVATVPEPASWVLLIAGFGLTGAAMRRRGAAKPVSA